MKLKYSIVLMLGVLLIFVKRKVENYPNSSDYTPFGMFQKRPLFIKSVPLNLVDQEGKPFSEKILMENCCGWISFLPVVQECPK
jgi:hypothetical protein